MKAARIAVIWAGALGAIGVLTGCVTYPRTVERSENPRPAWTTEVPKNDDFVYFAAPSSDARRQEDGQTDAFMQAVQAATASVNAQVLVIYERARSQLGTDDSKYGNAVKSGLYLRAAATINGARTEKLYWEKIENKDGAGEIFVRYNTWALISIPKEDLRKSLVDELKKIAPKVTPGDQDALDFLNKLEDTYKETAFPQ